MLKRQTWRAALFLITLFASVLGTFYPGAAIAQAQCMQEATIENHTPYYTNNGLIHAIEIDLDGPQDIVGVEVNFNNGAPAISQVDVLTTTSNYTETQTDGTLPYLAFNAVVEDVLDIRVYLVTGTTSSITSVRVFKTCSGTNVGGPTGETNETDPGIPSGDPANYCLSSNIKNLTVGSQQNLWPLQGPLTVPAGSTMRISFNSPGVTIEGITLAWQNLIEINGTIVNILTNGGWAYARFAGSNGKYKFVDANSGQEVSFTNVTLLDFTSNSTTNGILLGIEACPEVVDVNTLVPVNQVGSTTSSDIESAGFCNRALFQSTLIDGVRDGPQRFDKDSFGYDSYFEFESIIGDSNTISGIEVDRFFVPSFGQIYLEVGVPGGSTSWISQGYDEVPVSSYGNDVVRLVFDTPVQNVIDVRLSAANSDNVALSAKLCKNWDSQKPTAAVLLGDSFAGGEGASYDPTHAGGTIPGSYEDVLGWNTRLESIINFNAQEGYPFILQFEQALGNYNAVFYPGLDDLLANPSEPTVQAYPGATIASGLTANPENAHFCHRSENVQLNQANLAVDERFNLACSGAWPRDFLVSQPYYHRPNAGAVLPQIEQLKRVAQTHDIELVQIMVGGNNSHFTFSGLLVNCIGNFLSDAYFKQPFGLLSWGFQGLLLDISQKACSKESLGIDGDALEEAGASIFGAIAEVIVTMAALYGPDHDYKLVIQNYPSPIADFIHDEWVRSPDGQGENQTWKYRKLARHRYIGGCPVHVQSFNVARDLAHDLNEGLEDIYELLALQFNQVDIRFVDLSDAFDGKRLCEDADTTNDWFNPLRFMNNWQFAQGRYATDLEGWDKTHLNQASSNCTNHGQACQESMHPNAKGHKKMAHCLNQVLAIPSNASINDMKLRCAAGDPPD